MGYVVLASIFNSIQSHPIILKKSKIISSQLLSELLPKAATSTRRRTNHNIHDNYTEKVQRFLNVIESDSYVRPHYHCQANAWEGFIIIEGRLSVFQFDHYGELQDRIELNSQGPNYGIELDATFPHCISALSDHAIVFEYKQGPYTPDNDKAFPDWAPEEQESLSESYLHWLKTAVVNTRFEQ